jgi:hypothetical protein
MSAEVLPIVELSDEERHLLTRVYASLTECIIYEIEYHLESTFPEMHIEWERQLELRDFVAHSLAVLGTMGDDEGQSSAAFKAYKSTPIHVEQLAMRVVRSFQLRAFSLASIAARLVVDASSWGVKVALSPDVNGSGEWTMIDGEGPVCYDTASFASAADAFQASLAEVVMDARGKRPREELEQGEPGSHTAGE